VLELFNETVRTTSTMDPEGRDWLITVQAGLAILDWLE